MLETMYYGNSLRAWSVALLIVAGGIVLSLIFRIANRLIFRRLTTSSKLRYDDLFFEALEKPVLFGIILVALWVACGQIVMPEAWTKHLVHAFRFFVVLDVTWLIARFVVAAVEEVFFNRKGHLKKEALTKQQHLFPLVKRVLLIVVWIVGGVTALGEAGIAVTSLWGTLGIGGVALALAAQDTVKNVLGGITIFVDHPFRIGDLVRYASVEGTVEDIGLRSTHIRTYDKQLVVIPNYKLTEVEVTNISSEPGRRVVIKLGLTYDTRYEDMERALSFLRSIPKRLSDVNEKDLMATFSDYGDSALILTFVYFIRKQADIRETISKVNFEILRAFNEMGLNFAFPSQTIYLEEEKK